MSTKLAAHRKPRKTENVTTDFRLGVQIMYTVLYRSPDLTFETITQLKIVESTRAFYEVLISRAIFNPARAIHYKNRVKLIGSDV